MTARMSLLLALSLLVGFGDLLHQVGAIDAAGVNPTGVIVVLLGRPFIGMVQNHGYDSNPLGMFSGDAGCRDVADQMQAELDPKLLLGGGPEA